MKKTLTILLSLVSYWGFGQTNAELNGMIRQSLNYFPKVQEMNRTNELNELRVSVARSNYLPTLNGTGSYTYVNPVSQVQFPVSATETKLLRFQPYDNYNFNLNVNQVIWDFGRTQAQIEKAKADLLASRQGIEAAKLQVASQVATIYYTMIFLRKSAQVQDSVISFYEDDRKIMQNRIKSGDALQIDLSTIENNIDQEQNRKIEFQRLLERQVALMKYTTGDSGLPDGSDFDFAQVSAGTDVLSNPDLLAASERINAAQADIRLAGNNKLPSLSFQAAAGYKNGYQPNINELRFNYLAGVTLNFPIYQGGRVRQNLAIARKSSELSEIAKQNVVNSLQKDFESAKSDIVAYDQQIANSEGQIKVADEALRLTKVRYKQGVVTYLDLVNAATNVQRAYLTRIQYEYQKTLALVEIARLTGVKFWTE